MMYIAERCRRLFVHEPCQPTTLLLVSFTSSPVCLLNQKSWLSYEGHEERGCILWTSASEIYIVPACSSKTLAVMVLQCPVYQTLWREFRKMYQLLGHGPTATHSRRYLCATYVAALYPWHQAS